MLQKKPLDGGNVEVTFRMPPLDDVVELNLRGDFNGWQAKGVPLRLESDGTWVATLVLLSGRKYRFRYLDNQGRWHNDWEADAYVPNDYGSDDSVVDLTESGKVSRKPPAMRSASAGKKATGKGDRRDSRTIGGTQRAKPR